MVYAGTDMTATTTLSNWNHIFRYTSLPGIGARTRLQLRSDKGVELQIKEGEGIKSLKEQRTQKEKIIK